MKYLTQTLVAIALLIGATAACTKAQSDEDSSTEKMSYLQKDERITLSVARNQLYISGAIDEMQRVQRVEKDSYEYLSFTTAVIKKTFLGTYPTRARYLQELYPKLRVEPVLVEPDGTRLLLKGEVIVVLEKGATMPAEIKGLGFTITPDSKNPERYILSSNYATERLLQIVSALQNVKGVVSLTPNFDRRVPPKRQDYQVK